MRDVKYQRKYYVTDKQKESQVVVGAQVKCERSCISTFKGIAGGSTGHLSPRFLFSPLFVFSFQGLRVPLATFVNGVLLGRILL